MTANTSLFNQWKKAQILVVGDVMLDEYHWCDVDRISPEAPVPVCNVNKTTIVPGGAANVATNIHELGCEPILIGTIGKDSTGDKLVTLLEASGINTDHLLHYKYKPTTLKSRIMAQTQHVVRLDREEKAPLAPETIAQIQQTTESLMPTIDGVLLSDYAKGTLSDELIETIISQATRHEKFVLVDPKGDNYQKYQGASILTPNFKEFCECVKNTQLDEAAILEKGHQLVNSLQLKSLIVTRSEKGLSIITKSGDKIDIPTLAQDVYDITGAGDSFISTVACCLANGFSTELSALVANCAAGIVVGKMGTSNVSFDELRNSDIVLNAIHEFKHLHTTN